jgi:hypothetical protein
LNKVISIISFQFLKDSILIKDMRIFYWIVNEDKKESMEFGDLKQEKMIKGGMERHQEEGTIKKV